LKTKGTEKSPLDKSKNKETEIRISLFLIKYELQSNNHIYKNKHLMENGRLQESHGSVYCCCAEGILT